MAVKIALNKKRVLANIVSSALALALCPALLQARTNGAAASILQNPPPAQSQSQQQPQPAQLTPEQLQQIVAPIALYPDALVAQILAGSAYPTEIVEAERFLQDNPNLKDAALGAEVDKQDWDPSVKALTQFPSVLADMDKNLQWTSTLGDANVNQQADVMDAVQFMRQKAQDAGNLESNPQQTVTKQEKTIVIQPANPEIVYVPEYDPAVVYGYPVGIWPGFHPWWGVWGGGPYFRWGLGFGIGPWGGFGWGWRAWGFNWGARGILFGGGFYGFHSAAFYNRAAYARGYLRGAQADRREDRGENANRSQSNNARNNGQNGARTGNRPGNQSANRAGNQSGARTGSQTGTHSSALNGSNHGGTQARTESSRGKASMGGGNRGGGGGHGGGGHGGGGHGGHG
jgi:uncharacterized membrane protein YgcG